MSLKLKPLGDRLVVKPLEAEDVTASGLVLPETAKEKPQKGKILAVGPGRKDEAGKIIPMDVKAGQTVLFARYGGTEVKLSNDQTVLVLRESDILAVIEG